MEAFAHRVPVRFVFSFLVVKKDHFCIVQKSDFNDLNSFSLRVKDEKQHLTLDGVNISGNLLSLSKINCIKLFSLDGVNMKSF